MTRTKVLYNAQIPPPIHGASLRNKVIYDELFNSELVSLYYIDNNYSKEIAQLGSFSIRKGVKFIMYVVKLFLLLNEHRIDKAYMTYNLRPLGIIRENVIILLLRLYKVEIILHIRNSPSKKLLNSRFWKGLIRSGLRGTRIIYTSLVSRQLISKFNPKLKEEVIIANGIKDNFLESEQISNKILFVGNYRKEKGVLDLIEIASLLPSGYRIQAVGMDGDYSAFELNQMAKEANVTNINFAGPKYKEALWAEYATSSIFLYPTRNDVFPGVILEAMMYGMPIVTLDVGAIREMLPRNGVFIAKNILDMAGLIERAGSISFDIRSSIRDHYLANYQEITFKNKVINFILC